MIEQTDYVSEPVPGFLDAVGELVVEGDWVVVGVGGRRTHGLRLARVLAVEPETRQRVVRWEPKPLEEWTDYERRYYNDKRPVTRPVYEDYISASVTGTQYPDMDAETKPIRRPITAAGCLKYTGRVPFDLS